MAASAPVPSAEAQADAEAASRAEAASSTAPRAAMLGGIGAGLLVMCCLGAAILVSRRAPSKDQLAKADAALAKDAPPAAPVYPVEGDYVLVRALNRRGFVNAPPDANYYYYVTFEDDNTGSEAIYYEDLELLGSSY